MRTLFVICLLSICSSLAWGTDKTSDQSRTGLEPLLPMTSQMLEDRENVERAKKIAEEDRANEHMVTRTIYGFTAIAAMILAALLAVRAAKTFHTHGEIYSVGFLAVGMIGAVLYPPFIEITSRFSRSAGFHFIFSPPPFAQVDVSLLAIECIVIAVIGGALFVLARRMKAE